MKDTVYEIKVYHPVLRPRGRGINLPDPTLRPAQLVRNLQGRTLRQVDIIVQVQNSPALRSSLRLGLSLHYLGLNFKNYKY